MTKFNQVFTSLTTKTLVALSLFVSVESQAALCDQVWTGTIERARVQEQATGETVVRLYITPGHNADYVGYTTCKRHPKPAVICRRLKIN
jgi:hypothetical protein